MSLAAGRKSLQPSINVIRLPVGANNACQAGCKCCIQRAAQGKRKSLKCRSTHVQTTADEDPFVQRHMHELDSFMAQRSRNWGGHLDWQRSHWLEYQGSRLSSVPDSSFRFIGSGTRSSDGRGHCASVTLLAGLGRGPSSQLQHHCALSF